MKLFDYFNSELKNYVRVERFSPVEKIVYGGVGIILTSVLIAIVALAIKR